MFLRFAVEYFFLAFEVRSRAFRPTGLALPPVPLSLSGIPLPLLLIRAILRCTRHPRRTGIAIIYLRYLAPVARTVLPVAHTSSLFFRICPLIPHRPRVPCRCGGLLKTGFIQSKIPCSMLFKFICFATPKSTI